MFDVLAEAAEAIIRRRSRSLLTLLGVAFGVLTLISTIALTGTAAAQVSARFDALKATTVELGGIDAPDPATTDPGTGLYSTTVDSRALDRVRKLNGVVAAGVYTLTKAPIPRVSKVGTHVPAAAVGTQVLAVDPDALTALRATALQGRLLDEGHQKHRNRVVMLGEIAARNLGIDRYRPGTLVYLESRPYLLIGIITAPDFGSQLPLAAVVPEWVSRDPESQMVFGEPSIIIQTKPGAAQQVGIEAKVAFDPARPESLIAQVPPDPKQLRARVETDTRTLFLVMAAVSLLIGAIGIGNTTLVAVLERRHEVGLRRAVGASRWTILAQFLLESGFLGLLGGVLGTIAGVDLSVGVALAKDWTAVIPPWLPIAGPAVGLAVGLVAGLYPASRAARLEPVAALTG